MVRRGADPLCREAPDWALRERGVPSGMHRRGFIGVGAAAILGSRPTFSHLRAPDAAARSALWRPPELRPASGLALRANLHRVRTGLGSGAIAMTPGDGPIGPTLRVRRGERARISLLNELDEPTILHWHGLRVPEAADGHPRLAIGAGERYEYVFDVMDRAGTYWYHAHPHHRTGAQVMRGMAGMLIVEDDDEDALDLPRGAREIALLIQDRRLTADGEIVFDPQMHERMEGVFGDVPFGNGTPSPAVAVDSALYRLRVVNVTASRITRLALSTGAKMTLIGVDGGLLPAPTAVDFVDLSTGERADLLVDFSGLKTGTSVMLKSLGFAPPYRGMGGPVAGRGAAQGAEMDLLEFTVAREVRERPWTPRAFPTMALPDPARAVRTREFRFQSMRMQHTINGREFEMDRMDETVRFGSTEIWRFVNESSFPHPVHMHEVQFRILERSGGRGEIFPWERGVKDTALLYPGETISVAATFDAYRGRFLMHCHNLVHEDMGMMLNYAIE